jgi:hypothetical protein
MKNLLFAALAALVVFGATGCSKDPVLASSATVTRVELLNFPGADPNGNAWDDLSDWPDIYFLFESGTTVDGGGFVSTYYNECVAGSTVTWSNLSIYMDRFTTPWSLGIFDNDGIGSDPSMGSANFVVSNVVRETRPPYLELNQNGMLVRVYLTWFD